MCDDVFEYSLCSTDKSGGTDTHSYRLGTGKCNIESYFDTETDISCINGEGPACTAMVVPGHPCVYGGGYPVATSLTVGIKGSGSVLVHLVIKCT